MKRIAGSNPWGSFLFRVCMDSLLVPWLPCTAQRNAFACNELVTCPGCTPALTQRQLGWPPIFELNEDI